VEVFDFVLDVVFRNRVDTGQPAEFGGYAAPGIGEFVGALLLGADGDFHFGAGRKKHADDTNVALRLDSGGRFERSHSGNCSIRGGRKGEG
jgi:hypothetical protein